MSISRRLLNLARAELAARLRRERAVPVEAETAPPPETPPDIQGFYANLELPIGASAEEVRAAYRRLMARYHPDRHYGDAERERVAKEVATRLREAYEGLLRHLG